MSSPPLQFNILVVAIVCYFDHCIEDVTSAPAAAAGMALVKYSMNDQVFIFYQY